MSRGGYRPGSGRKKGSQSKATQLRQEMLMRCASKGITPLEVMLTAMRSAWDAGKVTEAVQHAVQAAPYVHPRLASAKVEVQDKRQLKDYSIAELEAILAEEGGAEGTAGEEARPGESGPVH